MSPSAQLVAIRREVKRLIDAAHQCLEKELRPALAEAGIHVVPYHELNSRQLQVCKRYFTEIIFPVLTPAGLRPGTSISAHLESEPQPCRADPRCGRRRAVRTRQSTRFAARAGAFDASAPPSNKRARRAAPGILRLDRRGDCGQPGCPFPGHADRGCASVPRHARRRYRDQGAGSGRSTGDHRGGRAAAQIRQRGAFAGEPGDAAAHPADPQGEPRTRQRRGLPGSRGCLA